MGSNASLSMQKWMNTQRECDSWWVLIFFLLSSALECPHTCSREVKELKTTKLWFGTVIRSLPSTHVEQNCLRTRILSPFAAAWPRKQPWAQPWTRHQQWPSPHTTSARKRPGESTDLREDTAGHKGTFTTAVSRLWIIYDRFKNTDFF